MTTRHHYSKELEHLQRMILRMGCMMEEALKKSMDALVNQDITLAQEVIDGDDRLDDMELEIEDICAKLIAREQPVASDLRTILTALKIITDLERMADHAVDISKIAIRLKDETYIKPLIDLPRMADIAIQMVKDSLEAYVDHDADKAEEITRRDDVVDGLNRQIFRELLTYMMENQRNITQATSFLFVSRYLERIGDHATNVCEWVIYAATGERKELNS